MAKKTAKRFLNLHSKHSDAWIIGIDEVGRGPLAGPVVACAAIIPADLKSIIPFQKRDNGNYIPLRDSKRLTARQREKWADFVKKNKIPHTIASVYPKTIDKTNISKSANLAATRAAIRLIEKLKIQNSESSDYLIPQSYNIYLDGELYLDSKKIKNLNKRVMSKTIIKGDELIPEISLASIIAKVYRDKKMALLHKKFPQYGFNEHKGYGTKKHFAALKKYGLSKIHRNSFTKNIKI